MNIAYKLATYYEGWRVKQHERQFGIKQMRVAIVTTSAARIRFCASSGRERFGRELQCRAPRR